MATDLFHRIVAPTDFFDCAEEAWRLAEIVRLASEEHAELVIMGTHGRGGVSRVLLGSVADRVIRTAPCPVLTVRKRE